MGLVFKSFLIIVLILLIFAFLELTSDTGLFTNSPIKGTEKLFYIFELERDYGTKVSIIESQNTSDIFLGMTADNLEFGIVPTGSISKRFINVANDDEIDYKILLIVTGNISPMVKFDKNDFVLQKGENAKVTISLDSSLASEYGNYTGKVSVISKIPRFSFLNIAGGY